MHFDDFFSSQYLNAADMGSASHIAQIVRVETKVLQDGKKKPALHFAGWTKPLLCNKTNALTIAAKLGRDMNSWVGHSLELFSTIVTGPNGPTSGIRLRVIDQPAPQPQMAPQPAPQPQGQPEAATTQQPVF
jgi:hypothetical protein